MNIAAQLYTVRELCQTPEGTLETLKHLSEKGFQSVQVSGVCDMPPEQMLSILRETGMSLCATHSTLERIVDDPKALIAAHKLWDCSYIGLSYYPREYLRPGGAEAFADTVRPAVEMIADAGLLFCVHNHRHEFIKTEGKNVFEWMCQFFGPQQMGFIADTYWIQAGGADPAAFIRQYADRVKVIHLKDFAMVLTENREAPREMPPGQGNLNWPAIMAAAAEAGVEHCPIEIDSCYGRDPVDCLGEGLRFMKTIC